MNRKDKIHNRKLIMFIMLWLLLAAIVARLLIRGQVLLGVGLTPIGYQISKITIKSLEK
jgi:accessory gene regulator protein AgrB